MARGVLAEGDISDISAGGRYRQLGGIVERYQRWREISEMTGTSVMISVMTGISVTTGVSVMTGGVSVMTGISVRTGISVTSMPDQGRYQ